jgi:ribulose-phosphate 3-epimerase
MISDPDFFLEECVAAGADPFLVHFEGNASCIARYSASRRWASEAGVVINPATSASFLEEILQDVDQVLVMTVDPGFGHEHLLTTTLPKISHVRHLVQQVKPGCEVEVDGGIDASTAPLAVRAGANVLVAGSSIFAESDGSAAAMEPLRTAIIRSRRQGRIKEWRFRGVAAPATMGA